MSLAQGRAQRTIAPNAKKNALAQLADLKNRGIKRSDQFTVRRAARRGAIPRAVPLLAGAGICQRAASLACVCPDGRGDQRLTPRVRTLSRDLSRR